LIYYIFGVFSGGMPWKSPAYVTPGLNMWRFRSGAMMPNQCASVVLTSSLSSAHRSFWDSQEVGEGDILNSPSGSPAERLFFIAKSLFEISSE